MINDFSILKPLKPYNNDWKELYLPPHITLGYDGQSWLHKDGFFAISSVEVVKDADGIEKGPEYHISMSKRVGDFPERVNSNDAQWILSQFGMQGGEEDNHVPNGIARNFWVPVNANLIGLECACKDVEPKVVEDKGDYVWRPT